MPADRSSRALPPAVSVAVAWLFVIVVGAFLTYAALAKRLSTARLADLDIYRGSVTDASNGGSLFSYRFHFPDLRPEGYGFTYPPSAALPLWPLAWLPAEASDVLWTVGTIIVLALMALATVSRLSPRMDADAWTWAGILASLLVTSYPAVSNLLLGQVSVFVAALTFLDAVVVPRRWRGILTGLAGGIKLLPLAFLALFGVSRQWGAIVRALGTFTVLTVVGFLVMPGDSWQYWTVRLWQTDNVGDPAAARNRSIYGMLLHVAPGLGRPAWLALAAVVGVLGLLALRRHARRGEDLQSAIVMGCLAIVVAPISWTHYLTPAVLAAWVLCWSGLRWRIVGVVSLALLCVLSPAMLEDDAATGWMFYSQALPTLFLVAVTVFGLPRSRKAVSAKMPA